MAPKAKFDCELPQGKSKHHIISREKIIKMIIKSYEENKEKFIENVNRILNQDEIKIFLNKIIDQETGKLKNKYKNQDSRIVQACITSNPRNLVEGPSAQYRVSDPGNKLDEELVNKIEDEIAEVFKEIDKTSNLSMFSKLKYMFVGEWRKIGNVFDIKGIKWVGNIAMDYIKKSLLPTIIIYILRNFVPGTPPPPPSGISPLGIPPP